MAWYHYLGHFAGAYFAINGLPHFIQGISGARFQTPFAKPPGVGESGPVLNVVWAWINFAMAGFLLFGLSPASTTDHIDLAVMILAGVLASFRLSTHLGSVRSGKSS